MPAAKQVNLPKLFGDVARTLKKNRAALNEADIYNHNHGDNMVRNFAVITEAMKEKPGASPSEQMAYASQVLGQQAQSGSAQLYSQGLARAARQYQGQSSISPENAISLVQALLGGGQAPQPQTPAADASGDLMAQMIGAMLGGGATPQSGGQSPDMLTDLISGLMGGGQTSQPTGPSQSQSDPLSQLMEGFLGGGAGPQPTRRPTPTIQEGAPIRRPSPSVQDDAPAYGDDSAASQAGGIDLGTLVNAGLTYYQATQQGATPLEAIVQTVMSGSQMNDSSHHSQSGQLVASSLISSLAKLVGGSSASRR